MVTVRCNPIAVNKYISIDFTIKKKTPWLRVFHAFSSVVKQMPGYKLQRRGKVCPLPKLGDNF
jgi:hypothetical protein